MSDVPAPIESGTRSTPPPARRPRNEFAAAFGERGFLVVFIVMLLAALGLNTAVQSMGLHFKKERVALRRELDLLPGTLGPWVKVLDQQLGAEVEHALGTKNYIQRSYVDSRRVAAKDIEAMRAMPEDQQARRVNEIMIRDPAAVVHMHVAYYTGLVDTVAHVPERCMVGGGFNPENPEVARFAAFKNVPGRNPFVNVKYVEFRDRARAQQPKRNVAYFFQVNGTYEHDGVAGVRVRLQNIFERYGYYAKIELATFLGDKTKEAQAVMTDFLGFAMPEVERCLPDWTEVTGAASPLNQGQ